MLAKTLKFSIFKSPNKPTLMTNILINYFRVLEVTSSLNCELEYKSGVKPIGRCVQSLEKYGKRLIFKGYLPRKYNTGKRSFSNQF
jgi:hypothetical protein